MRPTKYLPRLAALMGFPPGTGALIDERTRRRLVVSALLSVVLALLDMAGVVAMLPMMQYIAGQPLDSGALGVMNSLLGEPSVTVLMGALALLIVAAFIVKDVAAYFVRRWQLSFMAEQQVTISSSLLEGYLTGPYWWHLRQNTGDKLWTVTTAASMGYAGGLTAAMAACTELLTIVFIFGSLLFVSPVASVAAAVYFGLAALVMMRFVRPRILRAGVQALEASQAASKSSLQALTAVKEIKLRGAHGAFVDEFTTASRDNAAAGVEAASLNELPKYFLEIVFVVGVGLLAIAASGGEQGSALVLLGLFVAAGTRLVPSCVRLLNALSGIRLARSPLEHIVHVHSLLTQHRDDEAAAVLTEVIPRGDLAITGVEFAYTDALDVHVLRGVDLMIPAGRSLAIVGTSGAGKSTLIDLVLGLHRPTAGTISAGGTSIFDNLPGWQKQVAVVPQDVTLLDTSIRDNIAFDEELDEALLHQAIERAQLTDLVAALPDGLDTSAGERGLRLSGGQRQRIGIARALYRNPALLVLDEATSALDNETERRLTETIEGLAGEVTVIVVAHRLSTVRHCDGLAFMSAGRVASYGTFEEVEAANAEFAHLVRLGRLDPMETTLQA